MDPTQISGVPIINLRERRANVSKLIVRASEELGFFMVINHGVPENIIARMEAIGSEFFSLPSSEKQKVGPPNPLGYGFRSIGSNGDIGELEYLLLSASPTYISLRARTIFNKDPKEFSYVVNEYSEAMRKLACEILEILGEGLKLKDSGIFSRLIRDIRSDSMLRLNHYPPSHSPSSNNREEESTRVGFGEHTDPQILTLLRSTVDGLQIMYPSKISKRGAWVPIQPEPEAFCVHVGDVLQAMTNGRLVSVTHRAMVKTCSARTSLVYFGAPPLHAFISPVDEMITSENPRQYKSFTWGEYKKAMYTLRLGQNRLHHFHSNEEEEDDDSSI